MDNHNKLTTLVEKKLTESLSQLNKRIESINIQLSQQTTNMLFSYPDVIKSVKNGGIVIEYHTAEENEKVCESKQFS